MKRKYDSTRRKAVAEVRRAERERQRELKQFLRPVREKPEGRPRWERRAEAREKILPKDRKCPFCGRIKLHSRQWVKGQTGVGCKSCFMLKKFT